MKALRLVRQVEPEPDSEAERLLLSPAGNLTLTSFKSSEVCRYTVLYIMPRYSTVTIAGALEGQLLLIL